MWILRLIYENKDALLAVPHEIKVILLCALALSFMVSLAKSAWRLLKYTLIVAAIYFVLTYIGVI